MRSRQTGVTFIGWVLLLVPVAIVGYAGIRLTPVYLNYMKVVKALDQTARENGGAQFNAAAARVALAKRFDIDGIRHPDVKTVTVRRDGDSWLLEANYEDIVPMFANVSLLVHFDKRAVVE